MNEPSMGGTFLGRHWKWIVGIPVGILIVVGLWYGGNLLYVNLKISSALPKKGEMVTFVQSGVANRYVVDENSVLRHTTTFYSEKKIVTYENIASPVSETERVTLAIAPGIKGAVLGIFKADDSLEVLVSGDTNKSDLLVTKDGIAVYSAQKIVAAPPTVPLPPPSTSSGGDHSEDATVQTGHAGPPAHMTPLVPSTQMNSGVGDLYAVNIKTHQIRPLGAGISPRLLPDGQVIALAHEGVVLVNPATAARKILLDWPGADGVLSGISKTGTMIAVSDSSDQSADFFRLQSGSTYTLIHVGRLEKEMGAQSFAFIDDTRFFVRESEKIARLFNVPTEKLPVALSVATMLLDK